ncbi:MAG: hypothetical protein WA131_03975, partial [Desulfitobacteriaceae bacterium]
MKKTFLLASFSLILIVILALKQGENPVWGTYQKEYFNEQISKLHVEFGTANDEKIKKKIQQEIADYQNRQPEIINLILPNGKIERCKT